MLYSLANHIVDISSDGLEVISKIGKLLTSDSCKVHMRAAPCFAFLQLDTEHQGIVPRCWTRLSRAELE